MMVALIKSRKMSIRITQQNVLQTALADPGGAPGAPSPNGRGPTICLMP